MSFLDEQKKFPKSGYYVLIKVGDVALKLNYTHDTVETDKENMLNLEILNAKQIHLTDEDIKIHSKKD